jgi:peptidoglycan-associated lipoprotein
VSENIRSACALPEAQAHFAYNSSRVQSQDQQFLTQLSTCFTRGPLAKRRIHLVGHADPRGSETYNLALGRERADSVKVAMLMLGLSGDQVSTESRGEREARGTDEAGWARDRRVEASLRE